MAKELNDSELIQSFLPNTLSDELTRRYDAGNAALLQLIDHFSQRSQLEDTLAAAIEKAYAAANTKSAPKGLSVMKSQSRNDLSVETNVLFPQLQKEVGRLVRMHLHLSERINNEVVRPLHTFTTKDAWKVAHDIQLRLQQMSSAMHAHHEKIPKLSSRTVAKSAKASQQAKAKLEEEKQALMALQNEWQSEVAGLVAQFEVADVARTEAIRDALLRFEHYRSEFYKAAQADIIPVREFAQQYQPSPRIIDVLSGRTQSQSTEPEGSSSITNNPGAAYAAGASSVSPGPSSASIQQLPTDYRDGASQDDAPAKGFLKLNIFRSSTKRVKKKNSGGYSASTFSSAHSRSISSNIASPSIANVTVANISTGAPPSIRTARTYESDAFSPRSPGEQRSLAPSTSYVDTSGQAAANFESQGPQHATTMQSGGNLTQKAPLQTSVGDFAEWVFAETTQGIASPKNDSNCSVGSMVHINEQLSAIEEAPDSSSKKVDAQPTKECIGQTDTADHVQVEADNPAANIDDVFGSLHISASKEEPLVSSEQTSASENRHVDLDAVFNIPQQQQQYQQNAPLVGETIAEPATAKAKTTTTTTTEATAATVSGTAQKTTVTGQENAFTHSFDEVFGSADAFKPAALEDSLKKSPQMSKLGDIENARSAQTGSHRRSASTGTTDSPSIAARSASGFDVDDRPEGNESHESDSNDSTEQSFRVKFSIRDRAIKDNPDDSKAALSRVTTLLRSAPSARRGRNRRDIRTMYVPSSHPIPNAISPQDSTFVDQEQQQQLGFNKVSPPETPMPVRSEVIDDVPTVEMAEDIPAVTATALDATALDAIASLETAASIDVAANEATAKPIAEDAVIETAGPEANVGVEAEAGSSIVEEAANEDSIPASIKPEDLEQPTVDASPSSLLQSHEQDIKGNTQEMESSAALPPTEQTLPSTEKQQTSASPSPAIPPLQHQKSEGSGRRRAPPPPPPSASSVQLQMASGSLPNNRKSISTLSAGGNADASIHASTVPGNPDEHHQDSALPVPAINATTEGANAGSSTSSNNAQATSETSKGEVAQEQQLTASKSMHRGRRAAASGGPVPITMHARETLDADVNWALEPLPLIPYQVTGEVDMHIQNAINPLELAPLRICIKRAEKGMELVANPSVVVLDASFTASMNDGCEWYRFVRPNLFAQVKEPEGISVAVFKYLFKTTSGEKRVLPVKIGAGCTKSNGACAVMIFCEPNISDIYAGGTIKDLAVLLNMSGKITSQASRPTATWYQERNSLLWKLDDMYISSPEEMSEEEAMDLSRTLAVKVQGNGNTLPEVIAVKFEAQNSHIIDTAMRIVRVTASNQQQTISGGISATVVHGLASSKVKSGKYIFKLSPSTIISAEGDGVDGAHGNAKATDEHNSATDNDDAAGPSSEEEEAWSDDEGDSHDKAQ
ncbi:hypothetical protein GGI26_002943 [Coemansia sp. RSA 1358]|uniref:MHD domain-containing protein n=1 Tax=Coemansia umbellata TaxID=1424467 RepID=A0ABQ8PNV8_9FUNG|nr:hypothetical protein EDC05_002534 [Coemansia umbellata]KAJ2622836.1 hypothetical protein GGI26_002943 [Coemansia sp. RSA 1358]